MLIRTLLSKNSTKSACCRVSAPPPPPPHCFCATLVGAYKDLPPAKSGGGGAAVAFSVSTYNDPV